MDMTQFIAASISAQLKVMAAYMTLLKVDATMIHQLLAQLPLTSTGLCGRKKRTNGTITTRKHFEAWKNAGLTLGTFNYQIMAVEAWKWNGEATVSVE